MQNIEVVRAHNRVAWDRNVEQRNPWTIPVTSEEVARARRGELKLLLTPSRPVPDHWYPPLAGTRVLCLASGGGQQGPLLAAAGALVVVFDNSPRQLEQDRRVARREGLKLETIEGDAADLGVFADDAFGLVFHPCSNCFMPQVRPVWRESFRVLQGGGVLLAGVTNPVRYLFAEEAMDNGRLEVRHAIPYSDLGEEERRRRLIDEREPLEFGHSLEDQIGGQLDAGFVLTGFYEDRYLDVDADPLSRYLDTFLAMRAVKP